MSTLTPSFSCEYAIVCVILNYSVDRLEISRIRPNDWFCHKVKGMSPIGLLEFERWGPMLRPISNLGTQQRMWYKLLIWVGS